MAEVVVTGAGVCGLLTSMLLAHAGHRVTVIERDPMGAPTDADEAWERWERRGVNQFRLLHYFQPRFRHLIEAELPQVAADLVAAGALRFNFLNAIPDFVTGGVRPEDARFDALTGRRPMMEAAMAAAAGRTPGVEIRRGTGVEALTTGPSVRDDIPHVTGVRLDDGDVLPADLVVDATGRRSPLPRWLDAVGARPPYEELDDCGFIYYGRHFRSADGSLPPMFGAPLQPFGSISTLTLPSDHGTWGVVVITSAEDKAMRGLKDEARWSALVRALPTVAHWLDGEAVDDVTVMAKIEDRYRSYVVGGEPVATGVVPVGDSWACTNPSVGRGISIGLLQGAVLRDALARPGADHPYELVLEYDAATRATVEPWVRQTLWFDRHRLAAMSAAIDEQPYEPEDPQWQLLEAWNRAVTADPDLLRDLLDLNSVLVPFEEIVARPGFADRVLEHAGSETPPAYGFDRKRLVEIATA